MVGATYKHNNKISTLDDVNEEISAYMKTPCQRLQLDACVGGAVFRIGERNVRGIEGGGQKLGEESTGQVSKTSWRRKPLPGQGDLTVNIGSSFCVV